MEPLQEQSEQMRERVDGLLNALKKGQVASAGAELEQLLQDTCAEDPQQQVYLRKIISNLYPEVQYHADNMQQDSQPQLHSRPLADATNRTQLSAGSTQRHAQASKEPSSQSLSHQSSFFTRVSSRWPDNAAAAAEVTPQVLQDSDAATVPPLPVSVTATPEQLDLDTPAAAAVVQNLLHSQQSWRAAEHTSQLAPYATSAQHKQLHDVEQQLEQQLEQQQQTVMQAASQAPERYLLRFASQSAAATGPAHTGRLSRQHSSSTAATAAGMRSVAALGPVIRGSTTAAAADPDSSSAVPAAMAAEGGQDATGVVCFPRLWPAQEASSSSRDDTQHQQQQQQQQALLLQECSRGSLVSGAAAEGGQQEVTDAAAHAEAAESSSPDRDDGLCIASAGPAAAALTQQDAAAPAPPSDSTVARTSKALRHAPAQQAIHRNSSRQQPAQEPAGGPGVTSQQLDMPSQPQQEQQQNQQQEEQILQQEQQQQQLQVAAAAAATPASGVAGAAAPAPSTGTLPGPGAVQPVQLPPELGSAVQRALKALADPTPPRPLVAPDLNPAAVLAQQRRLEEADRAAIQLLGSRFDYAGALHHLEGAAAAVQDLAASARRATTSSSTAASTAAAANSDDPVAAAATGGLEVGAWLCVMPPLARFYQQEDCWQDLNRFSAAVDAEVAWRLAATAAAAAGGPAGKGRAAGTGRTAAVSFADDVRGGTEGPAAAAGAAGAAGPASKSPSKVAAGTPTKAAAGRSPGRASAAAAGGGGVSPGQQGKQQQPADATRPAGMSPSRSPAAAAAAQPKAVVVAFGRRVEAPLPAPSTATRPQSAPTSSSRRRLPSAAMAAMGPQGPQQRLPCFVDPVVVRSARRKLTSAAAAGPGRSRGSTSTALQRLQARRLAARAAAAAAAADGLEGGCSAAVLGSALSGLAGAGSMAPSEVLDLLVDAMMDLPTQEPQQQLQQQLSPEQQQSGTTASTADAGQQHDKALAEPSAAAASRRTSAPDTQTLDSGTLDKGAAEQPAMDGNASLTLNRWLTHRAAAAQQQRQFAAVYDITSPTGIAAPQAAAAAAAAAVGPDDADPLLSWWRQQQRRRCQHQQQQQAGMVTSVAHLPGFPGPGGQVSVGHGVDLNSAAAFIAGERALHLWPDTQQQQQTQPLQQTQMQPLQQHVQPLQQQQQELDVEAELLELLVDEIMGQRLLQRTQPTSAAAAAVAGTNAGTHISSASVTAAAAEQRAEGPGLLRTGKAWQQQQQQGAAAAAESALVTAVDEDMALLQSLRDVMLSWRPLPAAAGAVQTSQVPLEQQQRQQPAAGGKRQREPFGMLPGMARRPLPKQQQQQHEQGGVSAPVPSTTWQAPHAQQEQQQQQQQWQQLWQQQQHQVHQLWDLSQQQVQQPNIVPVQQAQQQQRAHSRQQQRHSLGHLLGLTISAQQQEQCVHQQQQQQQQQHGVQAQAEPDHVRGVPPADSSPHVAGEQTAALQPSSATDTRSDCPQQQGAPADSASGAVLLHQAGADVDTYPGSSDVQLLELQSSWQALPGPVEAYTAAAAAAAAAGRASSADVAQQHQDAPQGSLAAGEQVICSHPQLLQQQQAADALVSHPVCMPAVDDSAATLPADAGTVGGVAGGVDGAYGAAAGDGSSRGARDAAAAAASHAAGVCSELSLPSSACFRDSTESWQSIGAPSSATSNSRYRSSRYRSSSGKDLVGRVAEGQRTHQQSQQQQQQQEWELSGSSCDDEHDDDSYEDDFEVDEGAGLEAGPESSQAQADPHHHPQPSPQQQQQQQQQQAAFGATAGPAGGGWLSDALQDFARSPAATDSAHSAVMSPSTYSAAQVPWDTAAAAAGGSIDRDEASSSRIQPAAGAAATADTVAAAVGLQEGFHSKQQQPVPHLLADKSPILLWRPSPSQTSPAAAAAVRGSGGIAATSSSGPNSGASRALHSRSLLSNSTSSSSNKSPAAMLLRFPSPNMHTPGTAAAAGSATAAATDAVRGPDFTPAGAAGIRSSIGSAGTSTGSRLGGAQQPGMQHTAAAVLPGVGPGPTAVGQQQQQLLWRGQGQHTMQSTDSGAGVFLPRLSSLSDSSSTSSRGQGTAAAAGEQGASPGTGVDSAGWSAAAAAAAAAYGIDLSAVLGVLPTGDLTEEDSRLTQLSNETTDLLGSSNSSSSSEDWGIHWQAWLDAQGLRYSQGLGATVGLGGDAVGHVSHSTTAQLFETPGISQLQGNGKAFKGLGMEPGVSGGSGKSGGSGPEGHVQGLLGLAQVLWGTTGAMSPQQLWQIMQQQGTGVGVGGAGGSKVQARRQQQPQQQYGSSGAAGAAAAVGIAAEHRPDSAAAVHQQISRQTLSRESSALETREVCSSVSLAELSSSGSSSSSA